MRRQAGLLAEFLVALLKILSLVLNLCCVYMQLVPALNSAKIF